MSTKNLSWLMWPVVLSVMLLAGAVLLGPMALQATPAAAQAPEPAPGTVQGVGVYTLFATQQISNVGSATITYTNAPNTYKGLDMALAKNWNGADAFVTVAGWTSGGAGDALTVTAQLSADESNWADAYYIYIADTLSSSTSVITSTGLTTATTTASGTSAATTAYYRTIPTADGTTYFKFPIAGQYLRYKVEYSGTLTLTVQTAYRNN